MKKASSSNKRFWYSLDNAAKIFPAIISDEVPVVFRLTAVLKQPVKIQPFRKAVLLTEKRFPYFKVQLKEGFFWYYLEQLPAHIPIDPDFDRMCRKFSKGEALLRILVRDTTISIEFSHILTDGGGGFEFFRTILIEYAKACGKDIPVDFVYLKPDSLLSDEEYEDAYKRYFREEIPPMVKRSKAFHIPFPLNPVPRFEQSTHFVQLEQIKQVSRAKGVSITTYLVAAYLYVLQEIYEALPSSNPFRKNRIVRVQVPIDLRGIFPSKTMRNFSLFVMPELDLRLGHYTFEEALKTVYHQIQLESDEKLINKNIARNVGSEKKLYVRGIPLFLKSAILRYKSLSLGASQYSGVVTNLGKITLPDTCSEMIDYFVAIPPPPNQMLKINCGVVGFGDRLAISFGNITRSKAFENSFRQFLQSQGISMETAIKNRES
ncbi:MAG: hypothetical protein JXR22_08160 [Prolixibacteraceae bacterium]|nr:hypothetical protein [Prolixibacteraceae bacterium]